MGEEGERGELREEVKGRGEENGGEKRGERRKRKTSFKDISLSFSFMQQGGSTEEATPHKDFYATLLRFLHSCYPEDVVDVESQLQWHQTTHAYTHNWLQQSGYTIAAKYGSV